MNANENNTKTKKMLPSTTPTFKRQVNTQNVFFTIIRQTDTKTQIKQMSHHKLPESEHVHSSISIVTRNNLYNDILFSIN